MDAMCTTQVPAGAAYTAETSVAHSITGANTAWELRRLATHSITGASVQRTQQKPACCSRSHVLLYSRLHGWRDVFEHRRWCTLNRRQRTLVQSAPPLALVQRLQRELAWRTRSHGLLWRGLQGLPCFAFEHRGWCSERLQARARCAQPRLLV